MPTFQFFACIPHNSQLLVQEQNEPHPPTPSPLRREREESQALTANRWRFTLPTFEMQETVFWQAVDHVNREMRAVTGLDVTTLRCLRTAYHSEDDRVVRYYALENHSPERLPEGFRPMRRDELDGLPDEQRRMAVEWFDWLASDLSGEPEWYRPGWFAAASEWIQQQLERLKLELTAPIEQLRSWERSAILRVVTDRGTAYFKALPPMFAHEPRLTFWLAEQYPNHAPPVLALDMTRRWMLMADFGGETLEQVTDVAVWEAALFSYGQLQVKLMQRTPELMVLKCPDRHLSLLPRRLEAMLKQSAEQLSGSLTQFTESEINWLREQLPEIKRVCAELARFPLLPTLEHGDFWQGQVIVRGKDFGFIDWSDSSVSHPFFSMNFLEEPYGEFPGDRDETRERLRMAYLKAFTGYLTMPRLQQAYTLAVQLSPLHHALIYHQHILPQMRYKWEMDNMIPFYLKTVIGGRV